MMYYVYEANWGQAHRAKLHFSNCKYCNNGKGQNPEGIKKQEYGMGHSIPFKRHRKPQSEPVAISVIAIIVAPVIAKKE